MNLFLALQGGLLGLLLFMFFFAEPHDWFLIDKVFAALVFLAGVVVTFGFISKLSVTCVKPPLVWYDGTFTVSDVMEGASYLLTFPAALIHTAMESTQLGSFFELDSSCTSSKWTFIGVVAWGAMFVVTHTVIFTLWSAGSSEEY